MRHLAIVALAFVATLAAPPSAEASLEGDLVNCTATGVNLSCTPTDSVDLGPLPEFVVYRGISDIFSVNVHFNAITLSRDSAGSTDFLAGETIVISDLDWSDPSQVIIGVTLSTFNIVTGFDLSDISFGPDSVTLNMGGSSWLTYFLSEPAFSSIGTASIGLIFGTPGSDPPGGTVPEPGTLALLGLGIAGLAALRRRKQ